MSNVALPSPLPAHTAAANPTPLVLRNDAFWGLDTDIGTPASIVFRLDIHWLLPSVCVCWSEGFVADQVPLGKFLLWLKSASVHGGQLVTRDRSTPVALEFAAEDVAAFERDLYAHGHARPDGVFQHPAPSAPTEGQTDMGPWFPESVVDFNRVERSIKQHRAGSGKYVKRAPNLTPAFPSVDDQLLIRVDNSYLSGDERGLLLVTEGTTFADLAAAIAPVMIHRDTSDDLLRFRFSTDGRPFQFSFAATHLRELDPRDPSSVLVTVGDHVCFEFGCCKGDIRATSPVSRDLGDGYFAKLEHVSPPAAIGEFALRVIDAGTFVDPPVDTVQWLAAPECYVERTNAIESARWDQRPMTWLDDDDDCWALDE